MEWFKAWWKGLHTCEMAYVGWHDGSSSWECKGSVYNGQPVWATATAHRPHWWSREWKIDKATITYTELWLAVNAPA